MIFATKSPLVCMTVVTDKIVKDNCGQLSIKFMNLTLHWVHRAVVVVACPVYLCRIIQRVNQGGTVQAKGSAKFLSQINNRD